MLLFYEITLLKTTDGRKTVAGDTIIGFTDVSFECDCCHAEQMKTFYVCEDSDCTADSEQLSRDINKHQMTCPICDGESFSADIKLSNQIANHDGGNDG